MPAAPVRLFRITAAAYAADPFSGLGGLYAEGRWHPQGVRLAYAASTSSLTLLELLVQARREDMAARAAAGLVLVEAEVPARCVRAVEDWAALPDGWDTLPPPYAPGPQALGARFVREAPALALAVPSAVNPRERNVLVNPLHPDAMRLRIISAEPLRLDARLAR